MTISPEQRENLLKAASIVKLLRASASYVEKRQIAGLASLTAKDDLLNETLSLLNHQSEYQVIVVLVDTLAQLLGELSTLSQVVESVGRMADERQKAFENGMTAAGSAKGRKARAARDAKLDPVRQHALALASRGNFKSYRNASLSIAEEVKVFAERESGERLSLEQLKEKTIPGWLKRGGWTPKK